MRDSITGLIQADFEGNFWGAIIPLYKYVYLTKDGKQKTSAWLNLRPRDFIKQHDVAIISYKVKERAQ